MEQQQHQQQQQQIPSSPGRLGSAETVVATTTATTTTSALGPSFDLAIARSASAGSQANSVGSATASLGTSFSGSGGGGGGGGGGATTTTTAAAAGGGGGVVVGISSSPPFPIAVGGGGGGGGVVVPPPLPPPVGVAPPPWPTTTTQQAAAAVVVVPGSVPSSAVAGVGGGMMMPPPPPPNPPLLHHPSASLSASLSGEGGHASSSFAGPVDGIIPVGGGAGTTDSTSTAAVLLGLEELERQQADVEMRRERERRQLAMTAAVAARQQQQQQQQRVGGGGLPPLSPTSTTCLQQLPPRASPTQQQQQPASAAAAAVPSQIHLFEDDEDTTLSAWESGDNRINDTKPDLKRAVSIEKLRGSVQVGLRRLRSWSQDALNRASIDNPAMGSSVDSTQQATLNDSEQGGAAGGGAADCPQPQQRQYAKSSKKLTTSIESTARQRQSIVSEPELDDDEMRPLVYGYLHKLGRNGHWQHRFFETDGERLTYYKNVKRTYVLATLDLCKVGEITIDKTDPDECTFTIQVKNRPYFLRAESKARCNDWVIVLNRAREARMNVGNIQLFKTKSGDGVDGPHVAAGSTNREQSDSDESAHPCIVISALRPRTRAVRNFDGELDMHNHPPDLLTSITAEEEEQIEVLNWNHQPSSAGVGDSESMAKWQKRHSVMHTLSLRFLRWARSITQHAELCRRESDVVVVPTHVVRSMQQQHQLSHSTQEAATLAGRAESGASAAIAGGGGRRQQQPVSGLPVLIEMTPEAKNSPDNQVSRSRASTESRNSTDSPAYYQML